MSKETVQVVEGILGVPFSQIEKGLVPLAQPELLSPARVLGPPVAVGADCRVFLSRGISGRKGWEGFAQILVRQLVEIGCLAEWDIVAEVRTAEENDEITATNEYDEGGEDLVTVNVDAKRRLAIYSVSTREVDDMDLLWDEDCRAEAAADMIITHLMAEEGLLEDDEP